MALTTMVVTGSTLVLFGTSFYFYKFVKLKKVLEADKHADRPTKARQSQGSRLLFSALNQAQPFRSEHRALETAVADALALSKALQGSERSSAIRSVANGSPVFAERNVWDAADSLCHSLAQLCFEARR